MASDSSRMTEPKTSPRLREKLLSYQISRAEKSFATSSSTDSPPSPHGSTMSTATLASKRGRPPLYIRPHSSDPRDGERIKIHTIEEKIIRTNLLEQDKALRRARSSENIDKGTQITTGGPSKGIKEISDDGSGSRPQTPKPRGAHSQSSSGKEKATRPAWIRTRSGGVWYQNNPSPYDSGSTKSAVSYFSRQEDIEVGKIDISPLKPPPRPEGIGSEPVNRVVVETPFRDHEHLETNSRNSSTLSDARKDRRSSIDVRRLFSVPLTIFRRTPKDKQGQAPSSSPAQTRASHTPASPSSQRHFFRRDQTAATLNRVSSMLEAQSRPTLKSRVQSWTHKPIITTSSSEPNESRQSHNKTMTSIMNPLKKGSLDHSLEDTSSILNLLSGATPPNSTSEKATYRVRRRPSAESEEFLKIDISVRGGTSYLASEARRITTPPLPGSHSLGSRRGFFFDYKPPDWDEDICMAQAVNAHLPGHTSTKFETIGSTTLARAQSSPNRRTLSKAKTGDWYETQLADLDTVSEISSAVPPQSEIHQQCKHECQTKLAEMRRLKYEGQLDFSIPEHLPTSPLCPRNPKYWRVKEQKGSQFRGCWMHGYGEYEVVPGLRK